MSLGVENDADRVLPDCCNTAARRRVCCCCRAQHSAKRAAGPRAGALQGISAGSLHAAESVRRAAFWDTEVRSGLPKPLVAAFEAARARSKRCW